MGVFARLLLGLAAEALCERLRPTVRYVVSDLPEVAGQRWLRCPVEDPVRLRRPWQAMPRFPEGDPAGRRASVLGTAGRCKAA